MYKKILSITLSLMMAVSLMPCTVFASSGETIDVSEFTRIPAYDMSDASEKYVSAEDAGLCEEGSEVLPSAVDLRDRGVVTPVKLQNPFGSCWGFAAVSAAETSILTKSGKKYSSDNNFDLSEHHLAYFAMNALNIPGYSQDGEGAHWLNPDSSSDSLDAGGMLFTATSLFSAGIGPAPETSFPYRGKNGRIETYLNDNEELVNFCYSADDDWSIDESNRFVSGYELTDSYQIEGPSDAYNRFLDEIDIDDYDSAEEMEAAAEEERTKVINYIKSQINKGIGQSIGYRSDTSMPGIQGNFFFLNTCNDEPDPNGWCQYTPPFYEIDEDDYNVAGLSETEIENRYLKPNHGVSIVGYDDTFSKDNFNEAYRPPADGAFLIKNSWGAEDNEFPHGNTQWGIVNEDGKHTGYFWLSYYDATIFGIEGLDFQTVSTSEADYRIADQYTYMPSEGIMVFSPKSSSKNISMANIFTADENQDLYAVSLETSSYNSSAHIVVYLLNDNPGNPCDGTKLAEKDVSFEFGGYHRVNLDNRSRINAGQKYSVIITETNSKNANELLFPFNYSKDSYIGAGVPFYIKSVINRGESYLCYDNQWYDWLDASSAFLESCAVDEGIGDPIITDNFAIRAYSDPVVTPPQPDPEPQAELAAVYAPGKVKSLKLSSKKKKKVTAKWKAVSGAHGYEIAYKYKGKKNNWQTVTSNTKSCTISNLKRRKKVSIKVRAYQTNGVDYAYGPWTKVKNKKVK